MRCDVQTPNRRHCIARPRPCQPPTPAERRPMTNPQLTKPLGRASKLADGQHSRVCSLSPPLAPHAFARCGPRHWESNPPTVRRGGPFRIPQGRQSGSRMRKCICALDIRALAAVPTVSGQEKQRSAGDWGKQGGAGSSAQGKPIFLQGPRRGTIPGRACTAAQFQLAAVTGRR